MESHLPSPTKKVLLDCEVIARIVYDDSSMGQPDSLIFNGDFAAKLEDAERPHLSEKPTFVDIQ